MSTFEIIYSYIIILIPFAICLTAYYWLLRKSLKLAGKTGKVFALILILVGAAYTIYQLVTDLMVPISLLNFNFTIIIVNAIWFAIVAVVMAAGEQPEKGAS